jgi:hypothetical protein
MAEADNEQFTVASQRNKQPEEPVDCGSLAAAFLSASPHSNL